ncbi:hypothetical protein J132_11208, partial [Termitomyces sp. J132]
FPSKLCHKLRASVRDIPIGQTIELPDILLIQTSCSQSRACCVGRDEMGLFIIEVHYYYHCIIPMSIWEFHDEIHQHDTLVSSWNREWVELAHGCLTVRLGVETKITGASVGAYILGDLWPPIVPGYQLQHLPPPRMSCYPRVMMLFYNAPAELWNVRHINMFSEGQKPILKTPLI